MTGTWGKAVVHLVKAIALVGIAVAVVINVAASYTYMSRAMDLPPDTVWAMGVLGDFIGFAMGAVLVWAGLELAKAVACSTAVQRATDRIRSRVT